MLKKLTVDINKYIAYLNSIGFSVTVHGDSISGLLENNIHRNTFCSLVKTDSNAWQKCVKCQKKVFDHAKEGELFGMCYAGVEEYVYFANDNTFISVGGYGIDKEKASNRIERLARDFYLDRNELFRIYEAGLKHKKEDKELLDTLIKPLIHMLSLFEFYLADIPKCEFKNNVHDSILAFVQYNFMNDISLSEIAAACACSESTVSHLFKKHTGVSAKKYINNLRISQAKKFLLTSELSISTIAQMCGFSNINYFPTAFKKQVGVNPTEFRRRNNRA